MKLDEIRSIAAALAAAAPLLLAPPAAAEEAAAAEPDAVRVRADLDRYLRGLTGEGFSGSVLLARGGEIVLDAAYGHLGGVEMRTDSRYWLASISKQFTAAAVLKLAEEGRLELDESIDRYLPEVPDKKRAITLHHLLSHTSGLPQAYAADDVADRGEALSWILALPLEHAVGERFLYSNDNYSLAAAIVEIVSGRPFESYLRDRLFASAGMKDTGFWDSDEWESVTPTMEELEFVRGSNWGFKGPGGAFSTTGDLLRWWRVLAAGEVLSKESREKLLAPSAELTSGGHHAYGWFLSETPAGRPRLWTRGTEDFGANAILDVYPDDGVVLIALSHAGGPRSGDEARDGATFTRMIRAEVERTLFADRP